MGCVMIYEIRDKEKQCGSKIKYKTQKKAGDAIFRFHGLNPSFNSYHCPHCQKWHIGHKVIKEQS